MLNGVGRAAVGVAWAPSRMMRMTVVGSSASSLFEPSSTAKNSGTPEPSDLWQAAQLSK